MCPQIYSYISAPHFVPRTFIRGRATSFEHPWINYHIAGIFENLSKIRSYKVFTIFNFASKGHNLWSTLHMRTYVYHWENSACTSTWKRKVRGCLCIAMKGTLWRSVPPVRRVRSTSCCNYNGPFDCVRDDVLCAATCWLTLRDWRWPWLIRVPCGMAVLVQVGSSARET